MQLAILHYHLNAGGVARVIQNHLLALAACESSSWPDRVVLLQGRADTNWPHERVCRELPFPVDLVTVDGLDYDDLHASPGSDISVHDALAGARCPPEETLLHWHNHALGKNVAATLAVPDLAERGYKTLLQVHDFAEDFRPENYGKLVDNLEVGLSRAMYPQAEQIHYAVLNRRDYGVLSGVGVAEARLHMLPNPVAAIAALPDASSSRRHVRGALGIPHEARLYTYPVRGIRRKNVGELLLWSAALNDAWFLLTLAPENPVERAVFDRWRRLAGDLDLRCRLGKPGDREMPFAEIVVASDALVTTSVAEGFGMAFLEPWLAGRTLLGRNLREITSDAHDAGLNLDSLYDALLVPTSWVNRTTFVESLTDLVEDTYGTFRKPCPKRQLLEKAAGQMLDTPTIDFARLPSIVQAETIRQVASTAEMREQLLELNTNLLPGAGNDDTKIKANAAVVREHYSLAALGKRLAAIYTHVFESDCDTQVTPPTNADAVLDAFLSIDRLYPIRVES